MEMYSEKDLTQMKKNDIVKLFLNQQDKLANMEKIIETMKDMNERIIRLESQIIVSSKTSDLLSRRILSLERQLLAAQQYSRRECLDIVGISKNIEDNQIEDKVCEIISGIGVTINPLMDIQACHRVGQKGNVIVKFTNRKMIPKIMINKKKLQDREEKLFINESLCPLNRKLRGCCNKLLKEKFIHSIFTRNGMVKVRVNKDDNHILNIDHPDVLITNFPQFNFDFESFYV